MNVSFWVWVYEFYWASWLELICVLSFSQTRLNNIQISVPFQNIIIRPIIETLTILTNYWLILQWIKNHLQPILCLQDSNKLLIKSVLVQWPIDRTLILLNSQDPMLCIKTNNLELEKLLDNHSSHLKVPLLDSMTLKNLCDQ